MKHIIMKPLIFCVLFFGCSFSEVAVSAPERKVADMEKSVTERPMEVIVKLDDSVINIKFSESANGFTRIDLDTSLGIIINRLNLVKVKRLFSSFETERKGVVYVEESVNFKWEKFFQHKGKFRPSSKERKNYKLENYFIFYFSTAMEAAKVCALLTGDPNVLECSQNKNHSPAADECQTNDPNDPDDPGDPGISEQWGLCNIGQTFSGSAGLYGLDVDAIEAWKKTKGAKQNGERIVVAVTDTGVYLDHPDLYKNIWINQEELPDAFRQEADIDGDGIVTFSDLNESGAEADLMRQTWKLYDTNNNTYIDAYDLIDLFNSDKYEYSDSLDPGDKPNDLVGWDFLGEDNIPEYNSSDPDAVDENARNHGTAVAGVIGASMNDGGVVGVSPEVLIMVVRGRSEMAVAYAAEMGADIINCSWGDSDALVQTELLKNCVRELGTVVVFAAGNIVHSQQFHNALAFGTLIPDVMAISNLRNDGELNWKSVRGIRIDVAGPGTSIYSTREHDLYGYYSGTSLAAPFISGICALIKSLHYDWSPYQVMQLVNHTAVNVTDPAPFNVTDPDEDTGYDVYTGYGLANAANAVNVEYEAPECRITSPKATNRLHYKNDVWVRVQGDTPINVIARAPHYNENSDEYIVSSVQCILEIGPGNSPGSDEWTHIYSDFGVSLLDDELTVYNFDQLPTGRYTLRLKVISSFAPGEIFEDRIQVDVKHALIQIKEDAFIPNDKIDSIRGIASAPEAVFGYYRFEYRLTDQDSWTPLSSDFIIPVDFPGNHFDSLPSVYPVIAENLSIADIPDGVVYIRLAVYDKSSELYDSDTVRIIKDLQAFASGWPVTVGRSEKRTDPVIVDIDKDGMDEIIVTSFDYDNNNEYALIVLKHDGSEIQGEWPFVGHPTYVGYALGRPAVGDLNGNGRYEIINISSAGNYSSGFKFLKINAFDDHGEPLTGNWPLLNGDNSITALIPGDLSSRVEITPVIADLTGNGQKQVVFGYPDTPDGSVIRVLDHDGNDLVDGGLKADGQIFTNVIVGDIDYDGDDDIICYTITEENNLYWGKLIAFDGLDATTPMWTLDLKQAFGSDYYNLEKPILADIDGDKKLETIMRSQSYLFAVDSYGVVVQQDLMDNWAWHGGLMTCGDMDGDNIIEFAAHHSGEETIEIKDFEADSYFESVNLFPHYFLTDPCIADITSDGKAEVISAAFDTPFIFAHQKDGSAIGQNGCFLARPEESVVYRPPQVADLDHDGELELILIAYMPTNNHEKRVYVYDLQQHYTKDALQWPQSHHDPENSSNYHNRFDIVKPHKNEKQYAGYSNSGVPFLVSLREQFLDKYTTPDDFEIKIADQYPLSVLKYFWEDNVFNMIVSPEALIPSGEYSLTIDAASGPVAWDKAQQSIVVQEDKAYKNLLILIDRSGSMFMQDTTSNEDKTKLEMASTLANQYIECQVNFGDHVGFISFAEDSDNLVLNWPIVPNTDDNNLEEPILYIALLPQRVEEYTDYSEADDIFVDAGNPPDPENMAGLTSIGNAIMKSMEIFTDYGDNGNRLEILLISDGKDNLPPKWLDMISEFYGYNNCIRIHTIHIGGDSDTIEFMEEIAAITGGEYYKYPDPMF